MGIFDRMGKVISSNINSLLDKAESPEKSLDLSVREMGSSLKAAKKEIVEALGVQKRLGKKVDELDTEVEKWEKRAELALKADDESLAREALKHKKRVVAERDRAEAMRAEQRGVVLNMKREMERMEIKLEELKARKGTIANEMKRAKQMSEDPLATGGGTGGKAFEEFRRHEAKIDESRSEAEAMSEVDAALRDGLSDVELEQKFAALEGGGYGSEGKKSDAIDDELERLKSKLRIGGSDD
jgi:phage shock protein A